MGLRASTTCCFSSAFLDDLEVAGRGDLEVGAGTAGAGTGEALVEPRLVHAGRLRRVEDRDPAVGDLGGLRHVLRALGAEPDRDVGSQRVHDRLERLAEPGRALAAVGQRVVRPVVGDRRLAGQHLADDVDDLAGAGQRLRERLAVPALHHLRAAHAHAEHDPAAGEVVERERVHRDRRRAATRHLHDRRAEPQPRGVLAPPGQRGEGVGAPGLGGEDRVEPRLLGRGDQLPHAVRRLGAPVAELQSEFHGRHPSSRAPGLSAA